MEKVSFRLAATSDASAILRIYTPYIIETPITFECIVPSINEVCSRIKNIQEKYPYIVCEEGNNIIGYAYSNMPLKNQEAYSWNAELSIYIEQNYLGRGIGKRLYNVLLQILQIQKVKNVYGGITLPNEKSIALHKAMGFNQIAVYRKNGFKLGRWHDVVWYGKSISTYENKPLQFKPFAEIDSELVCSILAKA